MGDNVSIAAARLVSVLQRARSAPLPGWRKTASVATRATTSRQSRSY